jgi:predicted exporter
MDPRAFSAVFPPTAFSSLRGIFAGVFGKRAPGVLGARWLLPWVCRAASAALTIFSSRSASIVAAVDAIVENSMVRSVGSIVVVGLLYGWVLEVMKF